MAITAPARVVAAALAGLLAVVFMTATAATPAMAQDQGPTRIPADQFVPLPADPQVSSEALALREELLGPGATDPDVVALYWYGVSNFIVTVRGHLFLFDAWEIVGVHADYAPIGREELAALEPEAILVGHGDFDHAGDLGYIAGTSGATVVGAAEHCNTAVSGATREGVGLDFDCVEIADEETPPGTVIPVRLFADVDPLQAIVHVHSAAEPPSDDNPFDPLVTVGDPTPYAERFNDSPDELARFLAQSEEGERGANLAYHLTVEDLTVLFADTAGPLFDAPEAVEAFAALPGCTDVLTQAILGFGQLVSGLEDVADYVDAVRPSVFVPTHGDRWFPGLGPGQETFVDPWEQRAGTLEFAPETLWLFDPDDYLAETALDVDDPRWAVAPAGSRCATGTPDQPTADPVDAAPTPGPGPGPAPSPTTSTAAAVGNTTPTPNGGGRLPATGGGAAALGVLGALAALMGRRRRRS